MQLPIYRNFNGTNQDIIFIHIPKTAGTFITRVLEKSASDELAIKRNYSAIKQHYSLEQIQSFNEIKIHNTFIFANCRNPISKILSTYAFFENAKILFPTIELFIDFIQEVVLEKMYDNGTLVSNIFREKRIDLYHFKPQYEFIKSNELEVNVFKIEEDLELLIHEMKQQFNIDLAGFRFPNNHFDELRIDQKIRLYNIYKEDFEYFGYAPVTNE